jgi:hypothetical protein
VNRAGEAGVALAVAVVLGGTIGWLLASGNGSAGPSANALNPSAASSAAPASGPTGSVASPSSSHGSTSPARPTAASSGASVSVPGDSEVVSSGAVTVTADPPTAKRYQSIEISGTVEGATAGTTLEFARKDGDTLATTQVGRAGAYRLAVKLGRSGTFVVRAVDGTSVLATSDPFSLTVR